METIRGLWELWTNPRCIPGYQVYPLTFTTFWIEYQLWRGEMTGYHLNNIILHFLNAFLLWCILLKLNIPGALFAAAIFALHPVHVESVAWVSERKNTLSGLFYFFAFFYTLNFRNEIL
ncbi:MAG: hypothetical protein N2171_03555 [Clostridia bacterium]|nr:hypothetical protein [Clostridia bacterium]